MSSLKNELKNGSGRRLKPYQLSDGIRCYALADRRGSRSFVDDWLDSPRSEEKARRLLSTVLKISTNGLGWALGSRKIRRISLQLYEIKNFSGATRVMAHIRVADSVVLLHPFQGHRGTGNIPASTVANATRQQRLVVELLEQEEYDGD